MHRISRNTILILLMGLVLLAPTFEFFDDGREVQEGTDFVLVFLCVFVSIGLFTLCRRLLSLLFQLFFVSIVPARAFASLPKRSIEVAISPPESLASLGSLRI